MSSSSSQGSRIHRLVRAAKTNFYFAFVFLPRPKREAIFAAYAFSRHTDDLVDKAASPEAARRSLEAWRLELKECYRGRPRHPLTQNLRRAVRRFPAIREEHFELLIQGVEMDLEHDRYDTFDELYEYCYRVASVIGLICIEIFGYHNSRSRDYAVSLGVALQLTNILRDLREDARRNRIYLPGEDLRRFGYSESALLSGVYDDRFVELMQFQCARARRYYEEAGRLLPPEDTRRLFSAQIMKRTYQGLLDRIERSGYDVFRRPARLSGLHKLAIAVHIVLSSHMSGSPARST
jgi:phytoene synthase